MNPFRRRSGLRARSPKPGAMVSCGNDNQQPVVFDVSYFFKEFPEEFPDTIQDDEYCGLARELLARCHHLACCQRFVVFEGDDMGRRFLGCCKNDELDDEGRNCGFVERVDNKWPNPLKKALRILWDMYNREKNDRIRDNHLQGLQKNSLIGQYRKLEGELIRATDELTTAWERVKSLQMKIDGLEAATFPRGKLLQLNDL